MCNYLTELELIVIYLGLELLQVIAPWHREMRRFSGRRFISRCIKFLVFFSK